MKYSTFVRTAFNIFLATSLIGCATITRGTTNCSVVNSSPSEAIVHFSSGESCITPCVIEKKRKDKFTLQIEKKGYTTTELEVKGEMCPKGISALAGDALMIGSAICLGIDYLSGAPLTLAPNPVSVTLKKEDIS